MLGLFYNGSLSMAEDTMKKQDKYKNSHFHLTHFRRILFAMKKIPKIKLGITPDTPTKFLKLIVIISLTFIFGPFFLM